MLRMPRDEEGQFKDYWQFFKPLSASMDKVKAHIDKKTDDVGNQNLMQRAVAIVDPAVPKEQVKRLILKVLYLFFRDFF